jgi:predicted membrane channel-forming protein YqfA (hemolysin III family)
MMSLWAILTILGIAVMFLLVGTIILFLVSTVYHLVAGREKVIKDKPGEPPSDTLSKAA